MQPRGNARHRTAVNAANGERFCVDAVQEEAAICSGPGDEVWWVMWPLTVSHRRNARRKTSDTGVQNTLW